MLASKSVFSGSTEEFVFITEWNVISQYENAIDNMQKFFFFFLSLGFLNYS